MTMVSSKKLEVITHKKNHICYIHVLSCFER